jgi:sorbose reductase
MLTPEPVSKRRFQVIGNSIITGGHGTLGQTAARALLDHGLTGLVLLDPSLDIG